ncbi:hypothetical protein GCM10020221_14040 [Streptomyces thioluteus]|uniref:Uncharacterized protein n=1 Tax=Streptomyces thioluteus TaxID=66431 RepID=A0ABN3WJU3_STRTU
MRPVGGDPVRRVRGLGERRGRAARLRGDERRRGHRPQRLRPLQPGYPARRRQDVPDAQPRQPPGLGEAAQDDQARQVRARGEGLALARDRVHERLVHDEGAARAGEAGQGGGRVQHGGRVRRVADDDEVGVAGHGARVEPETVLRTEHHAPDLVPRVPQGRLRLGELRVHNDRPLRLQRPRQQHERLRGAGGQQDALLRQPVPQGDRPAGGAAVRVGGEVVHRGGDALAQPLRRGARSDVDRQIRQRRAHTAHFRVPVVAEIGLGGYVLRHGGRRLSGSRS